MGAANFFLAAAEAAGQGRLALSLPHGGRFEVQAPVAAARSPLRFVVRPERLRLQAGAPAGNGLASIAETVEERLYQGAVTAWTVRDDGGGRYLVREPNERTAAEGTALAVGGRAYLSWSPHHVVLLEEGGP